jgi:uncharacterized protein
MSSSPVPQVVVRGEAVVTVDPEVADVVVTVRATGRDRQAALERCRSRQEQVAAVIGAARDAVENEETTGVSVAERSRRGERPEPVATITTRVTVARLDAVGDLVGALGRLDDVELWGPTWRLRPGSPAEERARLAAIEDALRRARQYAAAFGVQLTDLLEVRDSGIADGGLRVAAMSSAVGRFEAGEPSLDLTPARQEVHGTVEVRFAMTAPDQEVFGR